jgi:hypothetical protein
MISLLTPTRKRPQRLRAMIDSVLATAYMRPEILCYVTPEDDSYDPLVFPEVHFVVGERLIMSDLWNALIPHAAGNIFMLCADDVLFRTKNWDITVEAAFAESADKILLCYGDDGGPNGKTFATLPFVSRQWVNTIGYFTGPGFSADFSDTWPQDVAEMIGRKKLLPILTEHCHVMWGKAPDDQTYQENRERMARDKTPQLYASRIAERQRDAEKLRAVMQP